MKFLAIDYGLARTGIAVTDAGGRMAFPRCTISLPPQTPKAVFFERLLGVIAEEAPDALVLGLPLLNDGQESLTTRQVRNMAARIQRRVDLPLYLMPELLSSHEAEQDLREAGLRASSHKAVLDQQAAVRILESFLAEPDPSRRLL